MLQHIFYDGTLCNYQNFHLCHVSICFYETLFFTCGEAVRSMTYNSPSPSPPPDINKTGQVGASKDMATYVVEVTDLKYEVRHDLRGCLEAVVTSEAAKTFRII